MYASKWFVDFGRAQVEPNLSRLSGSGSKATDQRGFARMNSAVLVQRAQCGPLYIQLRIGEKTGRKNGGVWRFCGKSQDGFGASGRRETRSRPRPPSGQVWRARSATP